MADSQAASQAGWLKYVKLAVLTVFLTGLVVLLVIQNQRTRQDEKEHEAERFALQKANKDYDNAKGRAEAPLDTPDYLGEPGFELKGNEPLLAEKFLEEAQSARPEIQKLKAERAAASGLKPFAVPNRPGIFTERHFLNRYAEFRRRELDAYLRHTPDAGEVKAAGEEFLRAYLHLVSGLENAPASEEVVKLAHRATEQRTRDPMVRSYAAFALYSETGDAVAAEKVWSETIQELRNSKYPRIVSFFVRVFASDMEKYTRARTNERRQALAVAIVRWLEEEGNDPQWSDCVLHKLEQLLSNEEAELRREVTIGCLQSDKVDPFLMHYLAGSRRLKMAWTLPGPHWASEPVLERWSDSQSHMATAADHLEYAWFLRPGSPYPSTKMMSLAINGYRSDYNAYDWFLRAVECRLDYWPAYSAMLDDLRPDGGGNYRQLEQFSRGCLATDRFDTFIPYVCLDMLNYVRESDFDGDWNGLKSLEAEALVNELLFRRERYRNDHPNEILWGDSAFYRTRLGLILEHLDRPVEALAEFQKANGDLDAVQLQDRNRAGWLLLKRLHAAQGPVRPRVLAFDESLRKRWPADTDPSALEPLERELSELRTTATDDAAKDYYRHAERILKQLRTYFQGEWVELDFTDGGLGWELGAETFVFPEGTNSVILSRKATQYPHVWARPLASFEPPFSVEADIGHVKDYVFMDRIGIQWTKPYLKYEGEWDPTQPFVGLEARWHTDSEFVAGKSIRRARQYYNENASYSALRKTSFDTRPLRDRRPGLRQVKWNLWDDVYEARIEGFAVAMHLAEPIAEDGLLSFGEPYPKSRGTSVGEYGGRWQLANVRIRRLKATPPPPEEAPLEMRDDYWTQRAAMNPDDDLAQYRLCEIRWNQRDVEEVLSLTESLQFRWPGMHEADRLRGLALFERRNYCEALDAFERAFMKADDDRDMFVKTALVLAAAPEEGARNAERAQNFAYVAKMQFANPDASVHAAVAAAFAEGGGFDQALDANRMAIELAPGDLKPQLMERQKLYEGKKPFRLEAEPSETP